MEIDFGDIAILSTFFGIYVAILVRKATDFMTQAVSGQYSFENTAGELLKYGVYILSTTIVCGIFMFLMRQSIIVMSRHIEYDLKNEIFSHYQSLDMAFYRRNNTGDLMNRISEDVSRVRMFLGPAVMYFASTIATLILVSATMSGVNIKLTLYALLPLPVLVIAIYLVSDRINKMSNKVQEQLSILSTIAQESFSGIRVLKAYAREHAAGNHFSQESTVYRKRYLALTLTEALFGPFILLMMGFSTILTIYIGGTQAITGQISYGNIVEFIIYIGKLTWPVASLGWVTSLVQRAAASQKRINEFLSIQPAVRNLAAEINYPSLNRVVRGDIEFRNVSFTYPDSGIKAINKLSFKVNSGRSVAIIGKTGSGKSSVASLLCRLYDVSEGEIMIDGINLKEWDIAYMRRQIGYVPQDTFLFSDTIENNILFGIHKPVVNPYGDEKPAQGITVTTALPTADIQRMEQAAKDAGIENEIIRFPERYRTMIGERGITLSGGQKQRVAIARAIIGSPRILIFDDCLSAVDTETEAEILSNLRNVMKDKTTILISHRVSTVKDASHIIALNNGRVEEEGSHQQLMEKKGFYYELYQMQLAEESKKSNTL
jgi:ATP-binding cassette, subfamily B, multidrug efflux pump